MAALAPNLWFGMRTKTIGQCNKANPLITSDSIKANHAARRPGCIIAQVFHSKEEVEDWIKDDDNPMPDLLP
jgi:hypothetical protein